MGGHEQFGSFQKMFVRESSFKLKRFGIEGGKVATDSCVGFLLLLYQCGEN